MLLQKSVGLLRKKKYGFSEETHGFVFETVELSKDPKGPLLKWRYKCLSLDWLTLHHKAIPFSHQQIWNRGIEIE